MGELRSVAVRVQQEIEAAKVTKARFAVEEKETQEFNMENGEFSLYRTLFDKDLSVTVFHNNKKGVAVVNRFDEEAIRSTVASAVASAESSMEDEAYDIAPKQEKETFHYGVYEPDMDKLFERTKELAEDIKKEFPKIQVMLMMVSHEKSHEIYWNSNGTEFESYGGVYKLVMEFSANEGEKTTSLNYIQIDSKDLKSHCKGL